MITEETFRVLALEIAERMEALRLNCIPWSDEIQACAEYYLHADNMHLAGEHAEPEYALGDVRDEALKNLGEIYQREMGDR